MLLSNSRGLEKFTGSEKLFARHRTGRSRINRAAEDVFRRRFALSVQLLDKTRKINKLLHNTSSSKVVFNDICKVMIETLESNILVLSRKGKVLGIGKAEDVDEISELLTNSVGEFIDKLLNERFLGVLSTKENVNLATLGFEDESTKK